MSGKVLLVTGGSRGIGAATALAAAEDGWRVAVNYAANAEAANTVVAAIRAGGGEADAFQADIGDADQIKALFAAVETRFGRLDGLVNNAGIVAPKARAEDMDAARINRMMRVNVTGTMLCAGEAVRRMSLRHGGEGGVIVNVSSAAARLGSPGWYVDYAASKAAVDVFTKGLSLETAAEGIRVNAVRPGIIATDIHASGGEPERVAEVRASLPMQREGQAEEVAAAIIWLLSAQASYVTGAIIDVSGGR